MLEVSRLTRNYGDFKAVDNVSFKIAKGEIVGLLGHNGAGKTTIMKMISGFLESNQGSVKVNGVDLSEEPERIQQQLGYLPENLPVYPEMTVAEYLDYVADLKGLKANNKRVEIKRAIKATDILEKLTSPISTLSRGYKQRVGVAQAILGKPKLLILDEPTNGLDPEQTRHMRELIKEIAQEATVILSTHIMQEVEAMCHRVLMIRTGQLVVDAKLESLKQSNHLILETSLPEDALDSLKAINGVLSIASSRLIGERHWQYQIAVESDADFNKTSALLGKSIFSDGYDIYKLMPEHRDLETLFREVNESSLKEEERNAA